MSTTEPIEPTATHGPVHVVGTGLLGTSVAMALTARHVPVTLTDVSPSALALARDLGAGTVAQPEDDEPALVVIAAPPDVTAELVAAQLRAHPGAVVTDVASVKQIILTELQQIAAQDEQVDLSRYVGSHPMAGRERSGAGAATADLFIGRPWVIAAHGASTSAAVLAIRSLALDLGASVATLTAAEHDAAVALISHLPQLMASLTAAQLAGAPDHALALAGQGLRDVTRIAASDARLWSAILSGNGPAVTQVLHQVRAGLDDLITAMDAAAQEGPLAPGAVAGISALIGAGNDGVARVPGKHGGAGNRYTEVGVLVPDSPGELGRLFSEIGEIGVNIEDFQMEHSPKQKVGMAIVSVMPQTATKLQEALAERGWRVVAP